MTTTTWSGCNPVRHVPPAVLLDDAVFNPAAARSRRLRRPVRSRRIDRGSSGRSWVWDWVRAFRTDSRAGPSHSKSAVPAVSGSSKSRMSAVSLARQDSPGNAPFEWPRRLLGCYVPKRPACHATAREWSLRTIAIFRRCPSRARRPGSSRAHAHSLISQIACCTMRGCPLSLSGPAQAVGDGRRQMFEFAFRPFESFHQAAGDIGIDSSARCDPSAGPRNAATIGPTSSG